MPYAFKKCSKCGEWKVASSFNFYRDNNGKFGLKSTCKECKKEYDKKYREENKDKIKQYYKKNKDKVKEYYEENKDKKREYNKQYYKKNKDKIREYNKEWREENREYLKEYSKQYRENNREYLKEYSKQQSKRYYKEHREERREYGKQYRENNREKIFNKSNKRRSKLKNQGRGITKVQLNECRNWFSLKCAYSGEILKDYNKIKEGNYTFARSLDHIVALDNGGLNEPWNIVPMRLGYNCSKQDKVNSLDWYMEQEYFNIDRLNKIIEKQIYAYEKWGGEEFAELILITDLLED